MHRFLTLKAHADPAGLTTDPEHRVESYWAANCAHCHIPGQLRVNMNLLPATAMVDRNIIDYEADIPTVGEITE